MMKNTAASSSSSSDKSSSCMDESKRREGSGTAGVVTVVQLETMHEREDINRKESQVSQPSSSYHYCYYYSGP